jgi:hypothetical protein
LGELFVEFGSALLVLGKCRRHWLGSCLEDNTPPDYPTSPQQFDIPYIPVAHPFATQVITPGTRARVDVSYKTSHVKANFILYSLTEQCLRDTAFLFVYMSFTWLPRGGERALAFGAAVLCVNDKL